MKQIANYPQYKVDVDGTVISYKGLEPRVLKPQLVSQSQKKYLAVGLFNEHNRRNNRGEKVPKFHYIHRLVYETYMGQIPEKLEVDHIDENPHNNKLENLRLVTPKQNARTYFRKEKGFLYSESRDEMLKDYLTLKNYRLVAEKWGCGLATVSRVIKNKRYVNNVLRESEPGIKDEFTQTDFRDSKFRQKYNLPSTSEWKGK
jgi:hypothetical protein